MINRANRINFNKLYEQFPKKNQFKRIFALLIHDSHLS
jgi:hypothetical protein